MKNLFNMIFTGTLLLLLAGCSTIEKLPSEDIEVLEKHGDIIKILQNPNLSPDSQEKYEAAKELISKVDLYFTRETKTVDKLFYHRDAVADAINSNAAVFTFNYQYGNKYIRIRFFTFKQFITRVEIKENE